MICRNIRRICEEYWLIENYEKAVNDKTQVWECHHRLEIQDDKILSYKELMDSGLYWHRNPEELIFLTKSEHSKLHKSKENLKRETREKYSQRSKGKPTWIKGKKHTEGSKQKMREAWEKRKLTPVSEETRQKLSESHKGKTLSKESRQKLSAAKKGKKLLKYSFIDPNGEIHIMDMSNAKKWHPDWKLIEDAQ